MLKILEIPASEWIEKFSEDAHRIVFKEIKPKAFDRIDYALLVIDAVSDSPIAYVTVRETDHQTVYWQFGGAFWGQKSTRMVQCYDLMLKYQGTKSKRMWTRIENENYPMLKLALSRQLKICGVFHLTGTTLVEMVKEWDDGNGKHISKHAEPNAGPGPTKEEKAPNQCLRKQ